MICKRFVANESVKKRMDAVHMSYDQCVAKMPASFEKCQSVSYDKIPATLDDKAADVWGGTLGECIGKDFVMTYLITKSDTPTASAPATDKMSKTVWLEKLSGVLPNLICAGFNKDATLSERLKRHNIDEAKCLAIVPDSIKKCETDLTPKMPDMLDEQSMSTWGHTLGECIGKDFALKHLIP